MDRGPDCFSSLPVELLQRIFLSVVFEEERRPGDDLQHGELDLITISSVSRHWREAAISCCALWTEPPGLEIERPLPGDQLWKADLTVRAGQVKRHLARSGTLPLKIELYCNLQLTDEGVIPGLDEAKELLAMFVGECHRWELVRLNIPAEALDSLSPIRNNIPLLRTFELGVAQPMIVQDDDRTPPSIDHLLDAPALTTVNVDMTNIPILGLDTSSLEDVSVRWGPDASAIYKSILESQSPTIKRFAVPHALSSVTVAMPSFQCILPSLRELDLHGIGRHAIPSIAAHVQMLTLPALASLRLHLGKNQNLSRVRHGPIFDELAALIRRSGCDIRALRLGPLAVATTEEVSSAVWLLLSLTPPLTEVHLRHIDSDGLRRLHAGPYDSASPPVTLPNLVSLRIQHRSGDWPGAHAEDARIDVAGLMDTFMSRNIAEDGRLRVVGQSPEPGRRFMDRVDLGGYTSQYLLEGLEAWEAKQFDMGLIFQGCPRPDDELDEDLWTACDSLVLLYDIMQEVGDDGLDFAVQLLPDILEQFEAENFERHSTSLLQRRNVPFLLKDTVARAVKCQLPLTTNPALSSLSSRVAALLAKWKPAILRDALGCPYRWKCDANVRACWTLKWSPLRDDDVEWFWKVEMGMQ